MNGKFTQNLTKNLLLVVVLVLNAVRYILIQRCEGLDTYKLVITYFQDICPRLWYTGVKRMTTNQIAYMNAIESQRHNQASENETKRSNIARETETHRANVANEKNTENGQALSFASSFLGFLI